MSNKTIAPWQDAIASAESKFSEIAHAQGNLVIYQKEAMFALQVIERSEALRNCAPASVRNAIINVASVGLSLNPATQYAALVPRKSVACLDIMYRGLVKLATDTGNVAWVKAVLVHAHDEFEYLGVDARPHHKLDPFASAEARGAIVGGYTIAKLAAGDVLIDTMSTDDFARVRACSKAKDSPWNDWFDEMCKKTLIKRAAKLWPHSERLDRGIAILNEHEGIDTTAARPPYRDAPASAAAATPISAPQREELEQLMTQARLRPERLCAAFAIAALGDLPAAQFAACKARLHTAVAARAAQEDVA